MLPILRSQWAFIRGTRGALLITPTPISYRRLPSAVSMGRKSAAIMPRPGRRGNGARSGRSDAVPGRCRRVQDLPRCRGCDPVPEPSHLALAPPVPPPRILAGQSQGQDPDSCCRGWPAGAPACAVVPLRGEESGVPAGLGTGRDREDLAPVTPGCQGGEGGEPEAIGWLVE